MTTIANDFIPAWNIIHAVEKMCANAFMCDLIEASDDNAFTAVIYAAYKDPNALVSKFTKAGGQVIKISGGQNNWYHFTFKVRA